LAEELLSSGPPVPTPAQIWHELVAELGEDEAPSERTIRDWIRKGTIVRRTDVWTVTDGSADDLPLVLPVLALLLEHRGGSHLYADTARWIARLRRAFPDLAPADVLSIAVAAQSIETGRLGGAWTMAALTRYLAYAPWRDEGAAYLEAFAGNRIREYLNELPGGRPSQEARAARRTNSGGR
jgi:hypothetical protein